MAKSKKSKKSKRGKKYKRPNRGATTAEQVITANQQVHSRFMQLPQEIRDEIYANVFCSTRFAFGRYTLSHIEGRGVVTSLSTCGTPLALLRTCRRVRFEVGISWLHQVLFHFDDPRALLDKLAGIPITVRQQIRHVRVSGGSLMLSVECGDDEVYYRTAHVLKLLPGLELDTLTVLGDRTSLVSYETLNMLVRYSDGWKKLHYLSPTSEFLGYKDDMRTFGPSDHMLNRYLRQPQPSDWQNALEQRDGQASHPSVVVYRANAAGAPGAILEPNTRKAYTQAFTADQDTQTYGKVEDSTLMRPEEIEKEVLVVVQRGDGVDYADKEGSPYLPVGDIREVFPGMTWKDIRAEQAALWKDSDDESDDDDDDLETVRIADTYSHVDEYSWPSLRSWEE